MNPIHAQTMTDHLYSPSSEAKHHINVSVQHLLDNHPPRFGCDLKKAVYEAAPHVHYQEAVISLKQWHASQFVLPAVCHTLHGLEIQEESRPFFEDQASNSLMDWYPHWSDYDFPLFEGWDLPVMHSGEIQCCEHPILNNLRSYLLDKSHHTVSRTVDEFGNASPILLTNVPRLGSLRKVISGPDKVLYGEEFRTAGKYASRVFDPLDEPTLSNLYAIAVTPHNGRPYTPELLRSILHTAYAAFATVKLTHGKTHPTPPLPLHIGYWGCGYYQHVDYLMALLQLWACQLAGIRRVVFHTSRRGNPPLRKALLLSEQIVPHTSVSMKTALEKLADIVARERPMLH
jgi:hypothetical protein